MSDDGSPPRIDDAVSLGDRLFAQHRQALVEARDFTAFVDVARDYLSDEPPAHPAARHPGSEAVYAGALHRLLTLTVGELEQRRKLDVALALDAYIAGVAPRLAAARQPIQPTLDLATSLGVLSLLSRDNLKTLLEDAADAGSGGPAVPALPEPPPAGEAEADTPEAEVEPAPPPPVAEPETPALDPALALLQRRTDDGAEVRYEPGPEPEPERRPGAAADDQIAAVDYDAILRSCLAARAQNRKVVAVVGLATTGKSFFVARLKSALARRYTWSVLKGVAGAGRQTIDRTKDVLLYRFNRIARRRSPENFDIYDISGDQFVKLVRAGFVASADDRDTVRVLYAICTFADALIFIAPSLQVLMRDTFLVSGDDLGLGREDREERARDIKTFIQSLDPLTKVIALLKEEFAHDYRARRATKPRTPKEEARAAAAESAVSTVVGLNFEQIQNRTPRAARLPMPALLLLSRADELRARLAGPARDGFDYDPAFQLLKRGREHLDNLAARFDAFSVDFLTAEEGHRPGDDFVPENPSFGAGGLVERWLLPAIGAARRPGPTRWLQAPSIAIAVRRLIDPAFAAEWRREAAHE